MQKIKVFIVSIVILTVITAAGISAQSMQIMDDLLAMTEADFGNSVYMITVGSGIADESVSVDEAVELITAKGWNKTGKSADKTVTLGELSYIIMQTLDMSGGIMYSLLPSPRYAVREFDYLGLITGDSHPGSKVSGEDVIRILSGAIELKEAGK